MAEAADKEEGRLARLRAEAEAEMRRHLPGGGGGRAAKRRKTDGEEAERQAGGRFEYGAVRELATGIAGFLLTCQLQRENSARKEAGPLLARYLQRCRPGGSGEQPGPQASEQAAAGGEEEAVAAAAADAAVEAGAQAEAGSTGGGGSSDNGAEPAALAAIKMPVRGLVALKLAAHPAAATDGSSGSSSLDADSAALVHRATAALLADIAAGKQARLHHVQRIVPVQTTCRLEAAALRAAGGQLAALVAAAAAQDGKQQQGQEQQEGATAAAAAGVGDGQRQLTFGIGLKQREVSGKPAGGKPAAPAADNGSGAATAGEPAAAAAGAAAPMDRGAIIAALAGGFEGALRQEHGMPAAVDLKAPDWVLICEVVPAGGKQYAALCALPRPLCTLKPKLHVQAVGRAGA